MDGPPVASRQKALRVAIDAHMVGERETGNETYIVNLVRGLAALDTRTRYLLYSPHPESLDVCGPLGANFARQRVRPGLAPLRIPFGLPAQALADAVDVLHVTYVAPPVVSAAVVATVHDISYALYPETFSARDRLLLGSLVPLTLRRAAALLTVSQHSRADIVRHYGIAPEKIHVVYQSISPTYRPLAPARVSAALARLGIAGRYLLAVGNLQPRKNLPRLIRAYASLRQSGVYTGRLVLAGRSRFRESAIFQEIRAQGLEREIVLTGYVPEEDVAALYNGADAFVYPSLYEGFGLPPLEAMACGCPVIASDTSALPEVVGDAGLLVNPTSEEALAHAIARVAGDAELRRTLVAAGEDRVRHFPADAAARTTLDVYQRVAEQWRARRNGRVA
jgi:glycosyltransferase involved in cell wall biosynthesis